MSSNELAKAKLHKLTPRDSTNTTKSLINWPHWPLKYNYTGNTYALTVVCNLTGYIMTAHIPDKKTSTIAVH